MIKQLVVHDILLVVNDAYKTPEINCILLCVESAIQKRSKNGCFRNKENLFKRSKMLKTYTYKKGFL